MTMEQERDRSFSIRLSGTVEGKPLGLDALDLTTLSEQIEVWKGLIGPDENPTLRMEEGSLLVHFVMSTVAALHSLTADISAMEAGNIDGVSPDRVKAYRKMIKYAKENDWVYDVVAGNGVSSKISSQSSIGRFKRMVREYSTILQGVISDAGGKGTPNIHVNTKMGEVVVSIPEEVLSSLEENILYKQKSVLVSYKMDLQTGQKSGYRFTEFVEQTYPSEEELEKAIQRATTAWSDVPDITQWVQDIRGGERS